MNKQSNIDLISQLSADLDGYGDRDLTPADKEWQASMLSVCSALLSAWETAEKSIADLDRSVRAAMGLSAEEVQ